MLLLILSIKNYAPRHFNYHRGASKNVTHSKTRKPCLRIKMPTRTSSIKKSIKLYDDRTLNRKFTLQTFVTALFKFFFRCKVRNRICGVLAKFYGSVLRV